MKVEKSSMGHELYHLHPVAVIAQCGGSFFQKKKTLISLILNFPT